MIRRPRDNELIDALEDRPSSEFSGTVWRIVRENRDPTECVSNGGRWDDGTFDVLYTSLDRETVIAEMKFHLGRGQPVIPSKIKFRLFELRVRLDRVLSLAELTELEELGLEVENFGKLSFMDHRNEYPTTQDIAEAAHFHGYQAILVPSARSDGKNLVIFCDQIDGDATELECDHGEIDWTDY